MTEDYLWDRTGWKDPNLVHLERVLGRLAFTPGRSAFPRRAAWSWLAHRRSRWPSWRMVAAGAGTLAATIAVVAGVLSTSGNPPLQISPLAGTPTIAARPLTDRRAWSAGRWLETDASARANIDLPNAGRVEIEPHTRIGLVRTRPGDYRLQLAHGTMQAVIWAPPGQVSVATPSSTAVDLGCVYSMSMDDDGTGVIDVVVGWVGFEWQGRESFIPAGATCPTRPRLGPGTPRYPDTSDRFRAALDLIDTDGGSAQDRTDALTRVLEEARPRDVVTLWHLLSRVTGTARERVFDRLSALVPPPAGVTREAVQAGSRDALDAWWDGLNLGTAAWWRVWKQQWRDRVAGK